LQRQIERRSAGQSQSLERKAQRANQQMARLETLNRKPERRDSIRGLSPEELRRHAKTQANLHAQLASGLRTGRPLRLNETDRKTVADIFGDADLLDPRHRPAPGNPRAATDGTQAREVADRLIPLPGGNANPRARLANAIRVRRAQISELRDRGIETGDETLLAKADRIEQKLDIFLHNQQRVEAKLGTVQDRIATRYSIELESSSGGGATKPAEDVQLEDNVPTPTDAAIDQSGLINESQN
jgi:hypothetical protein